MSSGLLSEIMLLRDGTSQAQRQMPPLDPAFILVEERSLADWISFARQYAATLKFFNDDNTDDDTWKSFLNDINVTDLVAYADNPDAFSGDAETTRRLSRPHLVLFVAFLQLLGYIKDQFNEFTKKHLDFYYHDILGLSKKGPVPDVANIIVQLADDVKEYFLEKGTQLLAGQDSFSKDLIYTTEKDTFISNAQVQKIKTFYTGKTTVYQPNGSVQEKWIKAYATSDAKASAFMSGSGGDATLYFNTFGKRHSDIERVGTKPPGIGCAVSSPQLLLQEGKRTITVTIAFRNTGFINNLPENAIDPSADNSTFPFIFYLSTDKSWFQIKSPSVQYTNSVIDNKGETYTAGFNNGQNIIHKSSGTDFSNTDIGKYFVLTDGSIYRIVEVTDATTVKVERNGKTSNQSTIKKYNQEDIYTSGLQAILTLDETDPTICGPAVPDDITNIQSDYPVVSMILNQNITDGASTSNYQLFKDLTIQKVSIQVEVQGLQTLTLQNDDAVLNYKKPFEPFSSNPATGSHFYFAHSELCIKSLNQFTLHFEWMNLPANFKDYYADYAVVDNAKISTSYLIDSNESFTAGIKCIEDHLLLPVYQPATTGGTMQSVIPVNLFEKYNDADKSTPALKVVTINQIEIPALEPFAETDEVTDWKRYFCLELESPDFQHSFYPALLGRQAYQNSMAIAQASMNTANTNSTTTAADKNTTVTTVPSAQVHLITASPLNPPYTPKLKSFTVDYSTSFDIDFTSETNNSRDSFFHINAFGYSKQVIKRKKDKVTEFETVSFMPVLNNEGELYIGLSGISAPQNLSLFFQLAEGSADPDINTPQVTWYYLRYNIWQPFQHSNILFDSTRGLLNTGIIEFIIPADASCDNTLLAENLYWLRAAVVENADAIPDTVNILTQGISARFSDNGNAQEHYRTLLAPGSIKETITNIPEIKKISQPYSSSKGKPAEEDGHFYTRASERLRHKGRGITMWDYEHLVLEQFSEIYKVKCVPSVDTGAVDIIVIPDIKGKLPFNPFQPKAPANTIADIQKYIEQRISAWTTVEVKNPTYTQVKVRIAVKIKEGYDESFFAARLEEELVRYLAPWAYEEGADIAVDSRLDADVIVNFVAERFYIAYAADIYLFTSQDSITFKQVIPPDKGEYYIQAKDPGEILVSASEHVIDFIANDYKEDNYQGIGYLKIGLDFKIGKSDGKGISYMMVGLDFKIG